MLKGLLYLFILFSFFKGYSQENESGTKLAYHSFSFSPSAVYTDGNSLGPSFSGDLRFSYQKNIFAVGAEGGAEYFAIFPGSDDAYYELNVYYGREFRIYKRLYADVFGGLGYVDIRTYEKIYNEVNGSYKNTDVFYSTIGVPLTIVVRGMLKRGFSIGLKFHVNLNPDRVIFSTGLHLQFTRKSRSPYK